MMIRRLFCVVLLSLVVVSAVAQEAGDKIVSIAQAADHAVQESKLTLAGGVPFHLKAHITNTGAPKPEYYGRRGRVLGFAGKMASHRAISRFFPDFDC